MTKVYQPQGQNKPSALGIAGGVVGGFFGGPAGASAGYSLGSSVDSSMKAPPPQQVEGGAMERRMGSGSMPKVENQQPVDDMKALEDANYALAGQPQEVQEQYAPAIKAAMLTAKRQQQRSNGGF